MAQPRTLAKFISEIIERTGLSNKEVAERLHIEPENVSRWLSRKSPQGISIENLEKLLGLLTPKLTLGACLFFPDEVVARQTAEDLVGLIRGSQAPVAVAQPPPIARGSPPKKSAG